MGILASPPSAQAQLARAPAPLLSSLPAGETRGSLSGIVANKLNHPTQGGKEETCCAGQGGQSISNQQQRQHGEKAPSPVNTAHRLPGHPTAWDMNAVIKDDMF